MDANVIYLVLITLVAAVVNGGLGYGFSSITVPLALLFLSNRVLNPALVLIEVALNAYVLFVRPKGARADWNQTDLWNSASAIPGVKVLTDDDGLEADRFDAHVSGQVALYDGKGNLLFHCGITESRGQVGDNAGRAAIETIVNQGTSECDQTVVFGCPLFDPDSECRRPKDATLNR